MLKILIRRLGFYLAASVLFMLAMLLCFTVFYHFAEGLDWLDSFYFTVITTRTIGFGDISPQTDAGKVGTILNALIPATVFLGTSLVVLETVMKQLENFWRDHHMKHLVNHDIIVSDLETLQSILTEYTATKEKFVVVSSERIEDMPQVIQGMLDRTNFLQGVATRDEVLEQAGIRSADTILIATNDDSFNLYVLVTANSLNPKIKKVVRINHTENAPKFTSVGADSVIPAASIVGQMMSKASFHPYSHEFLVALHTHTHDPFLEDVKPGETDVGREVKAAFPRAVALFREGEFVYDLEDEKIRKEDIIIKIHLKYKKRGGVA